MSLLSGSFQTDFSHFNLQIFIYFILTGSDPIERNELYLILNKTNLHTQFMVFFIDEKLYLHQDSTELS